MPLGDPLHADLGAALDARFADLRAFLDRRIAELSAELHASVQIADMGGAKLSAQIAAVHDRIATLVALPGAGARNGGLELEAVVLATEQAAERILEAAETIQDLATRAARDPAAAAVITERVNAIFEACSFQDLTSQRIRRAIQHLQQVEDLLQGMVPGLSAAGPRVEVATQLATVAAAPGSEDLAQAEIDRLLGG